MLIKRESGNAADMQVAASRMGELSLIKRSAVLGAGIAVPVLAIFALGHASHTTDITKTVNVELTADQVTCTPSPNGIYAGPTSSPAYPGEGTSAPNYIPPCSSSSALNRSSSTTIVTLPVPTIPGPIKIGVHNNVQGVSAPNSVAQQNAYINMEHEGMSSKGWILTVAVVLVVASGAALLIKGIERL